MFSHLIIYLFIYSLISDPPRPPGRPGLSDVRATEALVTWAPTDPTTNEDIIYRVDAKYSAGKIYKRIKRFYTYPCNKFA